MNFLKIIFAALILALPIKSASAQISIYPLKVVMDPRDRSAEVTVLNKTNKPSLYRISLIHYRQKSDGSYEQLDAPLSDNFNPEEIVRYSPRQFMLKADDRQKLRLSLRKPADLPEGEYRFHLLVQRYEAQDADQPKTDKDVAVSMQMNVGVSIPVIVRHGSDLSVNAKITEARYTKSSANSKNPHAILVNVAREGNISAIGNLSVFRDKERIAYIDNFNIFTDTDHRVVEMAVADDPRGKGALSVIYKDDKGNVINETTFTP